MGFFVNLQFSIAFKEKISIIILDIYEIDIYFF